MPPEPPKGFRDVSLIKPLMPGLIGIAKQAGSGISIDGEETKTDTAVEFVQFKRVELAFGLKVFVVHPCAEWERGTNENINGLLREFF